MANNNGDPFLVNSSFTDNTANNFGGGFYSSKNSSLVNVTLYNNHAAYGGGTYQSGTAFLTSVSFYNNSASEDGGGMYNNATNYSGDPTLTDVLFHNNSASNNGGGMYNNAVANNGGPRLLNVTFTLNIATDKGGGMYNSEGDPDLIKVSFLKNHAGQGGGFYNTEGNPSLINVDFKVNSSTDGGGVVNGGNMLLVNVLFNNNAATGVGGGIFNYYGNPAFVNTTFVNNLAYQGGGIYNFGSNPSIDNSILWDNIDNDVPANKQIYNAESSVPIIHNSLIQGSGGSGLEWNIELGIDAGGNLDANPDFLRSSTPGEDMIWGTFDDDLGDLRLGALSAAIDAGDNSVLPTDTQDLDNDGNTSESIPLDLANNPRFQDIITTPDTGEGTPPIADIGAYEGQPQLSIRKAVIPLAAIRSQEVTYTLTIYNAGPYTATGVIITDSVPNSITVINVSSNTQITQTSPGPNYVWHMADLPLGETGIITVTGLVATANNGVEIITNTATANANETDQNLDDNFTFVSLYILETVYVDANASGANDGTSWQNAFIDLQLALEECTNYSQIWVAEGVYKPTSSTTDRTATFELKDTVQVYGGFPTGGSQFTDRNSAIYPTILSGDIDNNDTEVPATHTSQIAGNNSYHIISADRTSSSTVLEGFIISGGKADGVGDDQYGGGIYHYASDSWLNDIVFSGNYAIKGGGMYDTLGYPQITTINFMGNSATSGGGIFIDSSNPKMRDVVFEDNFANNGGGAYTIGNDSNTILTNVSFDSNSASNYGGGFYSASNAVINSTIFTNNSALEGGGMHIASERNIELIDTAFNSNYGGGLSNELADTTLTNVVFNGNIGGGMYNSFGDPILVDVSFNGNVDSSGGGMYNASGNPSLTNVIFTNNLAITAGGGGLYNQSGSPRLAYVTFINNSALSSNGGGMRNQSNANVVLVNTIFEGNKAIAGGGLSNEGGNTAITNAIFSVNSANVGGGISNDNSYLLLASTILAGNEATSTGGGISNSGNATNVLIDNSIFWGNRAGFGTEANQQIFNAANSTSFIHYSLVQASGGSGDNWNPSIGQDGGGNIQTNPMFLRYPSPGADTIWGTSDDDYGNLRLKASSPTLDAGDNNYLFSDTLDLDEDGDVDEQIPFDLTDNPRRVDLITVNDTGLGTPPIADMGAYEAQPFLSISNSVVPQRAGPGQEVEFYLTFHNAGPETASGVMITDSVPVSITVVNISSNVPVTVTSTGPIYTWQTANIPPGTTGIITATGVVSTGLIGGETLWNSVAITAAEPDPNLADNEAVVPLYVTEIIYVDASANGASDGSSWTDAYTDLQDAFARAYPGVQIWVAQGIYKPTSVASDRMATFQMVNGTQVYGGFPSGGATFANRDPRSFLTILSGDIDNNDLNVPAANSTEIIGGNSYHVVTSSNVQNSTVLDGFTISGGQSNGGSNPTGGGLHNTNSSDLQLENVVFSGNLAINGGGMLNDSGSPSLISVLFQGNRATSNGGGLHNNDSDLRLTNTVFRGNTAIRGAGIYNAGSNTTLVNGLFSGNEAAANGGGMYNLGGQPALENVTFATNHAQTLGGGIYNENGSAPQINNTLFWGNSSGGGNIGQSQITNVNATPVIHFSLIQGALAGGSWDTSLGVDAGGNIDADPVFTQNPDPGPDLVWGTNDDDYGNLRLQAESAAIDAGDNNAVSFDVQDLDGDNESGEPLPYDLENAPRFTDVTTTPDTGAGTPPIVDIGAYEASLGLQVLVTLEDGGPLSGAIIYHLPAGQTGSATPLGGIENPLLTNGQGLLQAPGQFQVEDGLMAAWPVTSTEKTVTYYTSALPDLTGLDWHTITDTRNIQHLVVSPDLPLILFSLDVTLEWDARNNNAYLTQLEADLHSTSRILYDLTDGQIALGQVNVYQAREGWLTSNVIVHASNIDRPRAVPGGFSSSFVADTLVSTEVITNAYTPGQAHMPATWNRYGEPSGNAGEDWPRALAHELSHYLLFQLDNYLGRSESGALIQLDCVGSVMTHAYLASYSEFLTPDEWIGDCQSTLAQVTTGRSDWETIQTFYPMLQSNRANSGPSDLPLAATKIEFVDLPEPPNTLVNVFIELRDESGALLPFSSGRMQAFLIKEQGTADPADDFILPMGSPVVGQIEVRGAEPGDRLCVFDNRQATRGIGCLDDLSSTSDSLTIFEQPDWMPEIDLIPPYSNTLIITVTQAGVSELQVQIYPRALFTDTLVPTAVTATLTPLPEQPDVFTQTIVLPDPAFGGYIRLWESGANNKEDIFTFYLGGGWGPDYVGWGPDYVGWGPDYVGWGPDYNGWGVNLVGWELGRQGWNAPVISANGQVTVFDMDHVLGPTPPYILRALMIPPGLPSWFTSIGQAYQFVSPIPFTGTHSILFNYLQRDVPDETVEGQMQIYYSPDEGATWHGLNTELDTIRNQASTIMPAEGIYTLVSTFEVKVLQPGWNSVVYPLVVTRAVTDVVASLGSSFTSVLPSQETFLFDRTVNSLFQSLVNTLDTVSLGAYRIYATEPVTFYVRVDDGSQIEPMVGIDSNYVPPATFYGWITPTASFTPTVGMDVTAEMNGVLCGQGVVTDTVQPGTLAYTLQVSGINDMGQCGLPGRTVVFRVGEWTMDHNVTWDNSQAWFHSLHEVTESLVADDRACGIQYGAWVSHADPQAVNGCYRASSTANQWLVFKSQQATALSLITYKGPDQGIAAVYIDGAFQRQIDLYSADPDYQVFESFTDLVLGVHTVQVYVTGQKNQNSTGVAVRVDGFWVNGQAFDENLPAFTFPGWVNYALPGALNGNLRLGYQPNTWVEFEVTGDQTSWLVTKCPICGHALVLVDGGLQVFVVDTYAPTWTFQEQQVFSGMGPGTHTFRITVLGTKHPNSGGILVPFDGYTVP